MIHIVDIVFKKGKHNLFFILSLFFIFLTTPLATGQNKTTSDSILFKASALEEKVNIGYGTLKKKEVTGSVSGVSYDKFNKGNIQNPLQLIQGKVAGLDISKPGGDPNGSYYLRLRGLNTIFANTQPLVVIDGIIDAGVNNVDPNDIESITVLKDGSSAAIYGTRSSNGVILVTTKKGKPGTVFTDYNVYTTVERVAKNEPAMNATEWKALSAEIGSGTDYGTSTDWFKEIEQTALSQVHNISMSGGLIRRVTVLQSITVRVMVLKLIPGTISLTEDSIFPKKYLKTNLL